STLFGVLTRSPIVAILVTCFAWAILFGVGTLTSSRPDPGILSLVLLGLLVGFAGVMLIRAAIKGSS
ncbi:MAG: hypothetical protein ACI4XG_11655, partial [Bradyrhizobium sp.]